LDLSTFYTLGIVLIVVGVIFVIVSIITASSDLASKSKVKGAGIIMVGPIPIIFGTDKESVKNILVLALVLNVIVLITLVMFWLLR
jgi:uncharacterized protein (TIGR00304 family)